LRTELLRGRYEPLEVVGRGGEGEVLRARDHLHSRQVALKVRPVTGDASRAHLLSEARLLLSLSPHPGLPLVREDFFVDDRYVIAMDWIEGTDLEVLLADSHRPALEPALAIGYLEQAAEALEHLHGHEPPVVHGDVKPANLILTSAGRIVLVDFGLSSTPADDLRRAGTAGFMAPEVAAGAKPTSASDGYSFAATALTLLTGEPPVGGAPNWSAIEPERIPALERIMRSNLATDPVRRDASAGAFVDRLRRWWGAGLPSGTVTLVLADVSTTSAEGTVNEVAHMHGGECVSPVGDGPLLAAFASANAGLDAARELAARFDARVAAVTGKAEPRAGRYIGESASAAARLLTTADPGSVVIDDPTVSTVDGQLPSEIAFAVRTSTGPPEWMLVAPGLSIAERAGSCPYRGLLAFRPEDGDLYFGRGEVVASILERLLEGGFMAVVGASGSGKSSLVRAGLVPAYRRARDGRVVVLKPGSDPAAELERALSDGPPALLVVDQLEEVFTLCTDPANRARFVDALLDLRETSSTSIVVALRADFYGRCADHPRLATALAERQHLLGPMQSDELRLAIDGPARVAGLRLEAGLVEVVLADVEGEPGALPLLSHVLYESWVRRDGRVLTKAGYRAAGGVRGAISHTAEEVFLGCSEQERALVRGMFLRLTELGEATEGTRRRAPLAELIPEGGAGKAAAAVVERLAGARLLVVGDGSAEIAHEALIREWPRLRGWLAEDREALQVLRSLTIAARSWDEAGRDDADLYRGPRLATAAELADERQLSRVEREFLDASQEAQTRELSSARRRARRLRVLLAAVVAALVVAVIAGSFAVAQRGRARHSAVVAQSGRLAAQSREVAAKHPDLGLLLALEAGRLDDSVDSRGALLGALEHGSRIHAWLQGFDSPIVATAFSPDGKLLATVTSVDGTTLWNTATWKPVGPPLRSSQRGWEGADFSPDGRTLAIAGAKGRVELWDVSTRKELRELADPAAVAGVPMLSAVRFSPNGRIIAAGPQETGHVTLWERATGRVIGRPFIVKPRETGGAHSIYFSPDSKRIVVPGATGTVGIWDIATGRRVGAPITIGRAAVEEAIFAEGGRTLIASDDSGSVSIVDVKTGRPIRRPLSVGSQIAGALDLSPDGRLLAVGSYGGPVFVWDLKTGVGFGTPLTADTSPADDVAFSPDGRTLVSGHLRSAVIWSMSGEQAIGQPLGGPTALTTDVSFSPDGKRLATGRLNGDTVVYVTATRQQALRIPGGSAVTAVAFRPKGDLIAVGTIDGVVRLFDAKGGAPLGRLIDEDGSWIWQVAFSPNGKLLAIAADPNGVEGFNAQRRPGEVQLWDVDSRSLVGRAITPRAGSVFSLAFSPDGTLLATGSYRGRLDLWDVVTRSRHGKPMMVKDDGFPSVAFDPSGRLVAGGGAIGPVRVWRVADQLPAFPPLSGHTSAVTGTAFDPSGPFFATSSFGGGTRLWDPHTGQSYGDELVASAKPGSLEPSIEFPALGLRNAFSPDGEQLAVAGVETRAMLWDVDPTSWRRRACAIVGRNLTRAQWKLYMPPGTRYRATCSEWTTG
jgi:WD40 repeat protein/serine/threonine protein kinase